MVSETEKFVGGLQDHLSDRMGDCISPKRPHLQILQRSSGKTGMDEKDLVMQKYQICSRCVMDNVADDTITFDKNGICNYCSSALERLPFYYFPDGKKKITQLVNSLKQQGKGKKYDCMMGLSGGLDSSYLAYLGAAKWGLRILGIHVDDGFNTPLAEQNISSLCHRCGIELHVIKPDQKQFCDLTRAFILAGVPNIAIPQDNFLTAVLYQQASKYKINHFLSGANFALESILQRGNTHNAMDTTHIHAIHKRFGKQSIESFPLVGIWNKYLLQKYLHGIKTHRPLNYINYNLKTALKELYDFSGYTYYEAKHCESDLTKFMQWYYLPEKFGIDKRKSHFSSLIVTNQMSREEALMSLQHMMYTDEIREKDLKRIAEKLSFSFDELCDILKKSSHAHTDYPYSLLVNFASLARRFRKIFGE